MNSKLSVDLVCSKDLVAALANRDFLYNPDGYNLNCCIFTLIKFLKDIFKNEKNTMSDSKQMSVIGEIMFIKMNANTDLVSSNFIRNMLGIKHVNMIDVEEVDSLWECMLDLVFGVNYPFNFGKPHVHIIAETGNYYQFTTKKIKNMFGYVLLLKKSHYYSWIEDGQMIKIFNLGNFIEIMQKNTDMQITLPTHCFDKLSVLSN